MYNMGSALTVLLSISRTINLSLAATILIELLFRRTQITGIVFFIVLAAIIYMSSMFKLPITNYYESKLPAVVELVLVYLLFGILYLINGSDPMFFVIMLTIYSLLVFASLFPSGDFDKRAAANFWSGNI